MIILDMIFYSLRIANISLTNNNKPPILGPMVIVLGIHDGHNAGACLIKDGEVLAAINEERLNNIKNCSGIPYLAIKKVFEIANILPGEVNLITIASFMRLGDPINTEGNLVHKLAEAFAPLLHGKLFISSNIKFFHLFRQGREIYSLFDSLGLKKVPVKYIEHHLTHAASAFYSRSWDDKTLVLTLDGMGDGLSATVNIGQNFKIKRVAQTSFYDSIGNNLYSEITAYLGMKRWEHEYKIMGLAPYGKPEIIIDDLRKLFRINPFHPLEFENISGHYLKKMQSVYRKVLSGYRFDNIAAATQRFFEELVIKWVKNAIKETKIHKLACAGGSFLNVKVNKLIRELPEVDQLFIYPACDDGGSPVGAALEGYYRYCEEKKITAKKVQLKDIYYGQKFSSEYIREFLKSKRLLKKARQATPKEIAKLLSQGKIIARFAGRDEWGPRALGSRSIMADPRNPASISRLNIAIKQRDFWMPFAPSILQEYQSKYLKKDRFAPYMIEAFDTKEAGLDLMAALHPRDLTARPQIVNFWNPTFQEIIKEFAKITGVGGILNTSFNLSGLPLCGSPEIAFWTFQNSLFDGLLLDDWLIT